MDFYRSMAGRRFFEGDVPRLVVAVERLAAAFERLAVALEGGPVAFRPASENQGATSDDTAG